MEKNFSHISSNRLSPEEEQERERLFNMPRIEFGEGLELVLVGDCASELAQRQLERRTEYYLHMQRALNSYGVDVWFTWGDNTNRENFYLLLRCNGDKSKRLLPLKSCHQYSLDQRELVLTKLNMIVCSFELLQRMSERVLLQSKQLKSVGLVSLHCPSMSCGNRGRIAVRDTTSDVFKHSPFRFETNDNGIKCLTEFLRINALRYELRAFEETWPSSAGLRLELGISDFCIDALDSKQFSWSGNRMTYDRNSVDVVKFNVKEYLAKLNE